MISADEARRSPFHALWMLKRASGKAQYSSERHVDYWFCHVRDDKIPGKISPQAEIQL
jgi:hypothetical protein